MAKSSMSWLPSRVIDLGPPSGPIAPKLLNTLGSVGQYVTLTHRWTSLTSKSSTTLSNFESRKQYIDPTTLSQTFQDSFEATHRLGVRYLWIDAICIVQDSPEDWSREASNMRSIYEFAWLNIAVAGSEKDDGRLFMERKARLNRPCKLPNDLFSRHIPSFEGPIYAFISSESFGKSVFDGFLTKRGWILQERILSSRTVYFGQEEVFWECSTTSASETIPWGFAESTSATLSKFNLVNLMPSPSVHDRFGASPKEPQQGPPRKTRKISGPLQDAEMLAPLYNYWYRLVETYTEKRLTNPADRLPAIYGLAQALHKSGITHKTFVESYQSGVWLTEPASLLWYSQGSYPSGQDSPGDAPSYSWARWNTNSRFISNSTAPITKCDNYSIVGISPEQLAKKKAAIITLPDDNMKQVREIRGRHIDTSNLIQVKGHLYLGSFSITNTSQWTFGQPFHPIQNRSQIIGLPQTTETESSDLGVSHPELQRNQIPLNQELGKATSRLEPENFHTVISFELGGDTYRHFDVLLDKYPDEKLDDWLDVSDDAGWALRLCILHQSNESYTTLTIPWANTDSVTRRSPSGWYEYGLLLIPSDEDIGRMKAISELLEPFNIPSRPKPEDAWFLPARPSSPPLPGSHTTTWMRASSRMRVYDLWVHIILRFKELGCIESRTIQVITSREIEMMSLWMFSSRKELNFTYSIIVLAKFNFSHPHDVGTMPAVS